MGLLHVHGSRLKILDGVALVAALCVVIGLTILTFNYLPCLGLNKADDEGSYGVPLVLPPQFPSPARMQPSSSWPESGARAEATSGGTTSFFPSDDIDLDGDPRRAARRGSLRASYCSEPWRAVNRLQTRQAAGHLRRGLLLVAACSCGGAQGTSDANRHHLQSRHLHRAVSHDEHGGGVALLSWDGRRSYPVRWGPPAVRWGPTHVLKVRWLLDGRHAASSGGLCSSTPFLWAQFIHECHTRPLDVYRCFLVFVPAFLAECSHISRKHHVTYDLQHQVLTFSTSFRQLLLRRWFDNSASTWVFGSSFLYLRQRYPHHSSVVGMLIPQRLLRPSLHRRFARPVHLGARVFYTSADTPRLQNRLSSSLSRRCCLFIRSQDLAVTWSSFEDLYVIWLS